MNTIKNYIENLFQGFPQTEEVLKAKNELFSMMEDKYNELKTEGKTENEAIGIVISEFGNIKELVEEMGLQSYMSKNANRDTTSSNNEEKNSNVVKMTFEEVKNYIEIKKKISLRIAIGVMLCILSPVSIVALNGIHSINENLASGIGVCILLGLIAVAVAIFIISGFDNEKYEYVANNIIELEIGTQSFIRNQYDSLKKSYAVKIAVGVVLCVLSIIPTIIAGILIKDEYENEWIFTSVVSFLLIVVSIAVFLFIIVGMRMEAYKAVLQEGEYSTQEKVKKQNSMSQTIAGIYWPLVTAGYLWWSFTTMDWGRTWIIWPVAGILFGVIASICNLISKDN